MDTSSGSDTDDGDLEGSGGQQQEDSVLTWYLRTARLALALAVIANRPAGSSGRQAAQDLHVRLSGRQSWRARAEHLQDEVLRLRQELLLLHRVGCKPKSNAATGGSPEILAEDPRASPNTVLHGEGDSGCDTGSNTTSLLQSQDLSEAASIHPSLGRGLPFSDLNSQRKTEKTIILHVRFLRDLLALRKIKEVGHGATVAGDDAIIADSVCSLLSCMVSYCTDQTLLLPISFLPEAAQVVASVLEQRSLWKPDCTLYVKKVDDLLKQFTSLILNNAELNMFQMQEALADCLIHLGRCSLLKSSLVCHLLSEINHFADELWQACQVFSLYSFSRIYIIDDLG
ncbi:meiosis-specific protein MEI4 [Amia ocellicauda]|uniref:meiosis-specific protein MEI4 n=1 Tax=Amia ocellicauda TaxID=2972642 RepID=UPI003463F0AB